MNNNYYRIICEKKAMFYLENIMGLYEYRYEPYFPDFYDYIELADNLYELRLIGYYKRNVERMLTEYPNTKVYEINYENKKESFLTVKDNEIIENSRDIHYDELTELKYISFYKREDWINYIITIEEEDEENKYKLYIEDFIENKGISYEIDNNKYQKFKDKLNEMITIHQLATYLCSDYKKGESLEIDYEINPEKYDTMYVYLSNEQNNYYQGEITYKEIIKIKKIINDFLSNYNKDYQVNLEVEREISSKIIDLDDIDSELIENINKLTNNNYIDEYKDKSYHNTMIFYLDNIFLGLIGYEYDYNTLLVNDMYIVNDELNQKNIELIKKEFKNNIDNLKYDEIKYICDIL